METKVKLIGVEQTEQNDEILRHIIKMIYPLTLNVDEISLSSEFVLNPFSRKTKEEHASDIKNLMQKYLENPF